MQIMSVSELGKAYGEDVIFNDISFAVNKGDRIGIVGANGAGKTTLFSIINGDIQPCSGSVFIKKGISIGYLKQKNHFEPKGRLIDQAENSLEYYSSMEEKIAYLHSRISDTKSGELEDDISRYTELLEEYQSAGGYSYKSELKSVLKGMGFTETDYDKEISVLSGGEKTRLALACLLLKKPDLLMLDEPTNHLDLEMLSWLEQYLNGYAGSMMIVSHDRYFLDSIAGRIFDIRGGGLRVYSGNYTEYCKKRDEICKAELRKYEKQQKEIVRQEEIIRRFKQHNTEHLVKRARSREKLLFNTEIMDKPAEENNKMKLSFKAGYKSGNDVVIAEDISKSFGDAEIFENVSLSIRKGERICIIGENGVGKTTLLRIIMGEEPADDGYLKIGHNVRFGYYDQGQLLLDEKETVLGEMKNAYHMYTDTEMRSMLGRFLFRGDDVFKRISELSGGEKAKLSLLKLMLSGANTLVLDEPTNHLDIESKEIVESALSEFDGTVIIVSHDRYLLSRLPDRMLELTPSGITEYMGKFDYYIEKKKRTVSADIENDADKQFQTIGVSPANKSAEEQRREAKTREAAERRRARRSDMLEKRIEELENNISELEEKMCSSENISAALFLNELAKQLENEKEELDSVYEEWLELQ